MKPALIVFLTCLLLLHVQGQLTNRSNDCKCLNGFFKVKNRKLIAEVTVHPPSPFCPDTEIIIKTKDAKKKCVDPCSALGRVFIKRSQNRHEQKEAEDTTACQRRQTSPTH
ncbi:hypothetical protein LDENG_00066680 [Lucifuga dentata]|nr:hypothetical protein LDENG_00066680 [Lucifuga dentata]